MARYTTTVESPRSPEETFDYLADFENTPLWDPGVLSARRAGGGPIGVGAAFELVTRFGGRTVPLRYEIVERDPPRRVVLEAHGNGFASRDTITVEPARHGAIVHYDAVLSFRGFRRLLDPLMQQVFGGVGDRARDGLRAALRR